MSRALACVLFGALGVVALAGQPDPSARANAEVPVRYAQLTPAAPSSPLSQPTPLGGQGSPTGDPLGVPEFERTEPVPEPPEPRDPMADPSPDDATRPQPQAPVPNPLPPPQEPPVTVDPYDPDPYGGQPDERSPYDGQPYDRPYGGQPYDQQPYDQQPYDQQPYDQQPYDRVPDVPQPSGMPEDLPQDLRAPPPNGRSTYELGRPDPVRD